MPQFGVALAFLVLSTITPTLSQPSLATKITDSLLASESRRYDRYSSGNRAEDQIAKKEGYDPTRRVFMVVRHPREEPPPGHAPTSDPLAGLKTLAYNSDAIVIGSPLNGVSCLTASHQFVFSDYEVLLSEILSDKVGLLTSGSHIVITRPGGSTTISGERFEAVEPEFPLFQIGVQYIFFLHLDRETGSFRVSPSDVYVISENAVNEGRSHPKVLLESRDLAVFLSQLRSAIASDAGRQQ